MARGKNKTNKHARASHGAVSPNMTPQKAPRVGGWGKAHKQCLGAHEQADGKVLALKLPPRNPRNPTNLTKLSRTTP